MHDQHEIIITPDAHVSFVWDDELLPVTADLGRTSIRRVASVEPVHTIDGARWVADLAMIDGGLFGPFEKRQDALDCERAAVMEMLRANQL